MLQLKMGLRVAKQNKRMEPMIMAISIAPLSLLWQWNFSPPQRRWRRTSRAWVKWWQVLRLANKVAIRELRPLFLDNKGSKPSIIRVAFWFAQWLRSREKITNNLKNIKACCWPFFCFFNFTKFHHKKNLKIV